MVCPSLRQMGVFLLSIRLCRSRIEVDFDFNLIDVEVEVGFVINNGMYIVKLKKLRIVNLAFTGLRTQHIPFFLSTPSRTKKQQHLNKSLDFGDVTRKMSRVSQGSRRAVASANPRYSASEPDPTRASSESGGRRATLPAVPRLPPSGEAEVPCLRRAAGAARGDHPGAAGRAGDAGGCGPPPPLWANPPYAEEGGGDVTYFRRL